MILGQAVVGQQFATSLVNNTDGLIGTLNGSGPGTYTFGPFYNPKAVLRIAANISTITAGTCTVKLQGVDAASGAAFDIISTTALSATGLARVAVGPTVAAAANAFVQDYAPAYYQVVVTVVTGFVTGTIGASNIDV